MSKVRTARGAFTLIELLVVIAIISLLAAILFPVFARARENARKTSCANSIKQLTLAALQYTQDFDERWWQMRDPNNLLIAGDATSGKPFMWGVILQPYIKSGQIIRCPSAQRPIVSYTCNMTLPNFSAGTSLAEIPLAAQTPAFADAIGVTSQTTNALDRSPLFFMANGNIYGRIVNGAPYKWNNNREALVDADRHVEGAMYSFVDGHVKWMRPRGVVSGWFTAFTPKPEDLLQPPSYNMDYDHDGTLGTLANYD
jgi:prepilin-type N-terminal cleavage/methylation domain-containing protein/prepilin-type processing-associated H-X9-DG protein